MAIVAPTGRKHLSADALLRLVRSGCATIPDDRLNDTDMSLTDALMSAFAMFSLTSPSLLAFDQERAEGNVGPIYGMQHAPCDTPRRARLDPVWPEALRPSFQSILRHLQQGTARAEMVCLDGHSFLALDGTGDVSSQTMHCASCLRKVHRNGSRTSDHQMLGAALSHPDVRTVMPRMPEPIVQQEGTAKNDGERHAAQRCMAKLRQEHPPLPCIVTADSLRANAPHSETLHDAGCHAILGVKEGDHAAVFHQIQAAEHAGRVTAYERQDRAAGVGHRFRFVNDGPLHASRADVRGHCVEYGESGQTQVQHCSWVTDLRGSKRNV